MHIKKMVIPMTETAMNTEPVMTAAMDCSCTPSDCDGDLVDDCVAVGVGVKTPAGTGHLLLKLMGKGFGWGIVSLMMLNGWTNDMHASSSVP